MKRLPAVQRILLCRYLDCRDRTRRKKEFPVHEIRPSDDERLIRFILENSSVTQSEGECAYQLVADSVNLICKQLCPGKWCTRSHCEMWSSRHAYNCTKTRPSICADYKKYIANKKEREEKKNATPEAVRGE